MNRLGVVLAGSVVLSALPACSGSLGIDGPPASAPSCLSRTDHASAKLSGPLLLTAQSVPTATLVPCVRELPAGWTFRDLRAQNGKTRMRFELGKETGSSATVTLTRRCDLAGASATSALRSGARVYARTDDATSGYRGERYYLFRGGCVTSHFDVYGADAEEPVAAMSRALDFVDRAVLNRYVHDNSDGRLDLDPSPGG